MPPVFSLNCRWHFVLLMKKIIVVSLSIFFIFLHSILNAQTAWVREKGELYAGLSGQAYRSVNYYNGNGTKIVTSAFFSAGVYLYAEYGIAKRFTIITEFPAIKIQGYETTNTVAGIGDLGIGLKYAILKGAVPIALTVTPEFPIGNSDLIARSRTNSFETINLPTGDGEFNLHTKIAISHSFYPKRFYISGYGDFNFRTEYMDIIFRDQILSGIEFGYSFKDTWLICKTGFQKTLGDANAITDFSRGEGTDYSFFQAELLLPLNKKWSIGSRLAFFTGFPVSLSNIYTAPNFGITLAYKGFPGSKK